MSPTDQAASLSKRGQVVSQTVHKVRHISESCVWEFIGFNVRGFPQSFAKISQRYIVPVLVSRSRHMRYTGALVVY